MASKISNAINKLEEGVMAFLLASMVIITFSQVVSRSLFDLSRWCADQGWEQLSSMFVAPAKIMHWLWAFEASNFVFGWLVLMGVPYCVKIGSHIGIDMLVRTFSASVQRIVGLLAVGGCLVYSVILFLGGLDLIALFLRYGTEAEDMPIKLALLEIIIPLSFGLIIFRLLEVAWKILQGEQKGMHFVNETEEAVRSVQGLKN